MNVYKCDRCGKYFDRVGFRYGAELCGQGFLYKVRGGEVPEPVHVCFECAALLREFLTEWWEV